MTYLRQGKWEPVWVFGSWYPLLFGAKKFTFDLSISVFDNQLACPGYSRGRETGIQINV
jgi:hypothetical protein